MMVCVGGGGGGRQPGPTPIKEVWGGGVCWEKLVVVDLVRKRRGRG